MSVPPGTEMFQFPGFASSTYEFSAGYPRKGGFPHSDIRGSTIARISPRLFAACHVLHRLLAPRHPPNALITLSSRHHRPHAGPNRALRCQRSRNTKCSALTLHLTLTNQSIFTCQRTPARPPHPLAEASARRRSWKCASYPSARPNPPRGKTAGPARTSRTGDVSLPSPYPLHAPPVAGRHGGNRIRTGDPLLAKQVLYQLSYAPTASRPRQHRQRRQSHHRKTMKQMGQGGLEPPTPRLSSVCSNQLSYWPPTSATPKPQSGHRPAKARTLREKDARTAPIPRGTRRARLHQPRMARRDDWKTLLIGSSGRPARPAPSGANRAQDALGPV
jgi:hypothetical protein